MTLPHLMERHKEISTKKIVPNDIDTASEKAKFFTNPANAVGNDQYALSHKDGSFGYANDGTAKFLDEEFARASGDYAKGDHSKVRRSVIDVIAYWVNIIRTSVVNNASDPLYGPPLVRLNHGILYRDVPCIVTQYGISYPDKAGFDLHTLLPRIISVTLKMKEVRTGNFGAYSMNDLGGRDNLAGWESVVNSADAGHTMDPQPVNKLNYVAEGQQIIPGGPLASLGAYPIGP